jgi:hypothetical protein
MESTLRMCSMSRGDRGGGSWSAKPRNSLRVMRFPMANVSSIRATVDASASLSPTGVMAACSTIGSVPVAVGMMLLGRLGDFPAPAMSGRRRDTDADVRETEERTELEGECSPIRWESGPMDDPVHELSARRRTQGPPVSSAGDRQC